MECPTQALINVDQELVGLREVEVVLEDGSPHGEKTFVFWNPPIIFTQVGVV